MSNNSKGGVHQKQTDEHRPKPHEVGAKVWRYCHVNAEENQHGSDENSANTSHSRGFGYVSAAFPKQRAQHTPTVERITRKQIEDRQQEVSCRHKKEND